MRSPGLLNCVDLFAGAGGFSLGARKAGLSLRLAVEMNAHAASTYRRNLCSGHPELRVINDDIRKLDPEKLAGDLSSAQTPCHLLLGGPPCQGFSTHRLKDSGVADDRNDLIHTYFKFVEAFAPTIFLMENVPGMLWPRHEAALTRFYAEAARSRYRLLDPIILDARDFGIAQRRKRVFILGIRDAVSIEGLVWPPPPTHGSEARRRTNPHLLPWCNCSDAFGPALPADENNVHMCHNAALVNAFRRTPPNGGSRRDSGRTLKCHAQHDGHNDVYGRIDPAQPAPTMTTACINPSKGRFVHPTEHHGITLRQAARIQTFPDDFVFGGGLMAAGEQVGNAVPVELARILVEHVKPLLVTQQAADDIRRPDRQYTRIHEELLV